MKQKKRYLATLAIYSSMLLSHEALAAATSTSLNYVFQSKLFDTQYTSTEQDQFSEAQFSSGLDLLLSNRLLNATIDYTLLGHIQDYRESVKSSFSQMLKTSLHSIALNNLLGVDANLKADTLTQENGNSFQYNVTPGFSKSLYNQDNINVGLDVKYNYTLHKPTVTDLEGENKGYSLGLNGHIDNGRFSWETVYSDSALSRGKNVPSENTKRLDFNSRYKLVTDMHLEFSGALKNQRSVEDTISHELNQTAYGAGIAWSPSSEYSLAFKINKIDNQILPEQQRLFGSGSIIWTPRKNLKFSVDYGDQIVEGNRGLLFSTKLDLGKNE